MGGLLSLVPDSLLVAAGHCFSAKEFGILISGIEIFDDHAVDDLQRHTSYQGYLSSDFAILCFWNVVRHHFDPAQRAALLSFVHGCPRIPARGFKHLLGYDGAVHQFTVSKMGTPAGGSELR